MRAAEQALTWRLRGFGRTTCPLSFGSRYLLQTKKDKGSNLRPFISITLLLLRSSRIVRRDRRKYRLLEPALRLLGFRRAVVVSRHGLRITAIDRQTRDHPAHLRAV